MATVYKHALIPRDPLSPLPKSNIVMLSVDKQQPQQPKPQPRW